MKNSIRLVKIAQKDSYNDMLDSLTQKSKDREISNSNDKAQRYNFLKQKAEEMGISVADYIDHFGSFDDKKKFSTLANQQSASQKPTPEDNSIQGYEKVLNAFQFIKEKSEELNIPIIRIWEDIQLPSEIKNKVLTLVVNYQRLQEANQERKVQNNVSQSESLEDRLKKATENARFYSEQWNQAIDDAKNQNIDPIVYISAHYPDDLAQQIIAWYKIKTGEIDATNMEEYFAQSVEQVSNQEVESFNENYDDDTFQNFVDKAREFAENIDWEKAGAYLDEGKNRVIYQLLKPGSFIKKTSDSIKVIISMLTLKNVEKFNNEYYENQNNTQRAEQELDDYLRTSNINKRQILASLNKISNTLDNLGYYKLADNLTNISYRLAEEEKEDRELQFLNSPIEHHKERMFDPQHQDEEGTYNFTDLATGKKYYQNPFFGTNFLSEDHHINMKKMNELFGMFQGAISSIRRLELEELKKHRDVKYLKELILRTREYDQRIDDSAEYVSIEEFKDLIKLAERSYSFLRMYRILSPNEIDSKLNIIRAIKQKLQPTT
jgi:hypothetical protein